MKRGSGLEAEKKEGTFGAPSSEARARLRFYPGMRESETVKDADGDTGA